MSYSWKLEPYIIQIFYTGYEPSRKIIIFTKLSIWVYRKNVKQIMF